MHTEISKNELEFRWLEAAKIYEKAVNSFKDSSLNAAQAWQRIGNCYDFASRQATDLEDFNKLREKAAQSYEKAADIFGKSSEQKSRGEGLKCSATAEYMRSWIASNSAEKAISLRKCYNYGREALDIFKETRDDISFSQTCNILSQCLFDRVYLASVESEKKGFIQEGIGFSDQAISIFDVVEKTEELVTALYLATLHSWYLANIDDTEALRKEASEKCLDYSGKALKLSGEIENPYVKAESFWAAALATVFFSENLESALSCAKQMWKQASSVRDNYLKGIASYFLAFSTDLMIPSEANPNKKRQMYVDIIRYSENGIKSLNYVGQDSAIAEVYLVYPTSYSSLAREYATTNKEKLAFAKKAVRIGEKGLEYALRSGSSDGIASNLHSLSKAYHYFSNLEPRTHEKPELLKIALGYRKEYVEIVKKAFESNLWTLGLGLVYAAQVEADLSAFEPNEETKGNLVKDAVSDMEGGVESCEKWIESIGSQNVPTMVATVAGFEDKFGSILKENYAITEDKNNLTKAIEVYDRAAQNFREVDLPSRVAESYWKIATDLDFLGNYEKAADNFGKAFAGYKVAARKIEQFGDFYIDYSNYMRAWSEIENAKLAHKTGDYDFAMQHYQKGSSLLGQSKQWNYLSLNFYAWSLLEQSENLSIKEQSEKSIKSFESAIKFIQESKKTLQTALQKIGRAEEEDLVKSLIEASNARETYSLGRIAIEEAKILDRQGKHLRCSEKYGDAFKLFRKITEKYSGQIVKETKPLVFLCQAWQKMTMAEAKKSPIMYEEAAELFKKANEYAINESSAMLALAHSRFCKALETGTEFEITLNMDIYKETKKHLDSAADYYLKAGFESFSEYTKATRYLFEAYVYMHNAKRETDFDKEAQLFSMAEKVLNVSADSYAKAQHQEKTENVRQILQKVKEEKEMAVSLSEVFHAPTVTSSTRGFTTISPTFEMAVGLERFEHADIQAKVILPVDKICVGEDVSLEMQIVNVGKEPVLLTGIEEILPDGFRLIGKPDGFSFENLKLSIMGKQLDPLKTEQINLKIRSFKSGDFELRPKIICVDEIGQQLIFTTDPAALKVSEAVMEGRVPTGYKDLDNLLMGGLPEEYGVVLTSPSNDERDLLIKKFLETGLEKGEVTFFITTEASAVKSLVEKYQSIFYLFLCNPRADVMIESLSNVYKMKGVDNLTDIDISLVKAFRGIDRSKTGPKRACIEVISDVLLQHRAIITRKWLSGLLPDLRSRGFTTLAVVNPQMHPTEEVHAILGLFDGEIRISENETQMGLEKILRIRKMYNQRYVETGITVTKQRIES
jgi:KaiC/GvpD/RAD55 family RecA-like ATPase